MPETDEPFPPSWKGDRDVVVVVRPVSSPTCPFVLWCCECHRIVNAYETAEAAETARDRHEKNGAYHRGER